MASFVKLSTRWVNLALVEYVEDEGGPSLRVWYANAAHPVLFLDGDADMLRAAMLARSVNAAIAVGRAAAGLKAEAFATVPLRAHAPHVGEGVGDVD